MDIEQMRIEKEKAQDEIRNTLLSLHNKTGASITSFDFDAQRDYEADGRVRDFDYLIEIHCEL